MSRRSMISIEATTAIEALAGAASCDEDVVLKTNRSDTADRFTTSISFLSVQ